MEQLLPIIMGPLVAVLVETAKRVPVIPFDGASRAAVLAALIIASLLVRFALAYVTGTLEAFDFQTELKIAGDALMAAFVAAGQYSLVQKKTSV